MEQETDGAVGVESENVGADEEEAAVITALLSSYKEALADNNDGKIAEIEASLKSIEDAKFLLEDKVASLSNDLSVERDRLIRISADFDNFRKRTEREWLNLVSNAQGEVVENLLAVLDNFERAKSQIKVETEGEERVTNSYQSIYKQFVEILGSLGVIHVETVGKQFDPMEKEAENEGDGSIAMWKGVVVAYIVVAICYFPVAFVCYYIFGNTVDDNVLMTLQKPIWLIAIAFYIAFQRDKRIKLITGNEQMKMKMSMQRTKGINGGK